MWALRSSFSIEKKKGISHYFGPILAKLKRKKKTTTFKKKPKNLISFDVLLADSAKVLPETADNGIICFHFIVLLLLLESSI